MSPGFCYLTLTLALRIWCDAKTNPFFSLFVRIVVSSTKSVGWINWPTCPSTSGSRTTGCW